MSAPILPAEIWLHIFGHFCPHCGSKDMPDFSPPSIKQEDFDYESGKSALAALSPTSRHMRELSQPVLYHCFYDHPYRNNMSKFLRTLISQPQLARCVRVLSLPGNQADHIEHNTRGEFETWNEASKSLGLPPPRWMLGLFSGDTPAKHVAFDGEAQNSRLRYLSATPEAYFRAVRSWQHCITIGLCSTSLTHLAMFDMYVPDDLFCPGQPPEPFNFPNLRMVSCHQGLFFKESHSYFSQAPLLDRVAAGDIFCPFLKLPGWSPPKLLTNLQSLSFGCVPNNFKDIIGACKHVQDLEVYLFGPATWDFQPDREPMPVSWPASIKRQVRRLCWDVNDFNGWEFPWGEGQNFFPPIRDFLQLEILEIDRISLHAHVMRRLGLNTPGRDEVVRQVPSFLPPSIRILHLSSELRLPLTSWSTMIIELEALAEAKETTLRRLSVVQLDLDQFAPHHAGLPDFMERVGVVRAMRDVGIELKFGQERRHFHYPNRGMLPPLPGNLDYFPEDDCRNDDWRKCSVNNFALEYLAPNTSHQGGASRQVPQVVFY